MSSRLISGGRLILASHNPGKIAEFCALFAPYHIKIVSARDIGAPEPEETGGSFGENACLKAKAAAAFTGETALADDSGLEVEALNGAPGIFSARWAGPEKDFRVAMERLERELRAAGALKPEQRRANFTCALCLASPDGQSHVFEGRVYGRVIWPPRGDKGFGYDPVFVPEGHDITFGEMEPEEKERISHRMAAFRKLVAACLEKADGG